MSETDRATPPEPALIADRSALVGELRRRGVDYLMPTDVTATAAIEDQTLLSNLASHSDPRLRQALIALFLLQPHLAVHVATVRHELPPPAEQALLTAYMAAVYLQRMWRVRLSRYLAEYRELPDLFSHELSLPDPSQGHGKPGLHALAAWQSNREQGPFNHLSEYESAADLLLSSLALKRERA